MNCKFCSKEFSRKIQISNHERSCRSNPDRKKSYFELNKRVVAPWNKGLTKESDPRVAKNALSIRDSFLSGETRIRVISDEGRKRLSDSAKRRGLGGYRPHPNKGIRYKDIWFDSKWELRVAVSLDENKISWVRPKNGFIWNDEGRRYYPDFYLPEYDVYLDPKNSYLQKIDADKIDQAMQRNKIQVIVLSEHQLEWKDIAPLVK